MSTEAYAVRCRVWRDGALVLDTDQAQDVVAHVQDRGTLVWVDLVDPSPADVERLGQQLGLNATFVEDAVSPHERPKVVRHADHVAFTAYGTSLAPDDAGVLSGAHGRLRTTRVSGFVLPAALITVRSATGLQMAQVVTRWEDNPDLLRFGPGALLYGLLDHVVDSHFDTIQELDDHIEALEDDLLDDGAPSPEFVRRLYWLRKDLVELRRVVLPMQEVVNGLLRHRSGEDGELGRWYDDLYDHVLRATEWTESLRDLVTTLFETNLSLQDIRLNVVMKKLAAWAAIIAVPTAVTGWFGQNVPYPGFSAESGVWESVALILVLSVGLYVAFKRRDWL